MHKKECECETCKKRSLLEKNNPDKEVGLQYAFMQLEKELLLLVSAEEVQYFNSEVKIPTLELEKEDDENFYTIAYGVFSTQTNWHEDFYDLHLAKGAEYFYLDSKESCLKRVNIEDYAVLSKKKDKAKVCLLLKTNHQISFPNDYSELAITLTKTMYELGNDLTDLIFSRIEYGVFRLDKGQNIENRQKKNWTKKIDKSLFFEIDYDRFLLFDL